MKLSIAALLPLTIYAKPSSDITNLLKTIDDASVDIANAGNQWIANNLESYKAQAIETAHEVAHELLDQLKGVEEAVYQFAEKYDVDFDTDAFEQLKNEIGAKRQVIHEAIEEVSEVEELPTLGLQDY